MKEKINHNGHCLYCGSVSIKPFCDRQCYLDYVKIGHEKSIYNRNQYEQKQRILLTDRVIKRNIYIASKGKIKYADMTPEIITAKRQSILKLREHKAHLKQNQTLKQPAQKKTMTCCVCNNEFKSFIPHAKYCSIECSETIHKKHMRDAYIHKPKRKLKCKLCGSIFESNRWSARYCSDVCSQRAESSTKHIKARLRQKRLLDNTVVIELVTASYLYRRDGGKCQICKRKVNMKLKHPHPMSASIDHIIPVSKGGEHTKKNTRLAHMICNARRQDHYENDQLRLFG